jgi:hypothetical protein
VAGGLMGSIPGSACYRSSFFLSFSNMGGPLALKVLPMCLAVKEWLSQSIFSNIINGKLKSIMFILIAKGTSKVESDLTMLCHLRGASSGKTISVVFQSKLNILFLSALQSFAINKGTATSSHLFP